MNNYRKAGIYFRKAAALYQQLDQIAMLANTYTSLGQCYSKTEDFDAAFQSYDLALISYQDQSNLIGVAETMAAIAVLHHQLRNFQIALDWYQQAKAGFIASETSDLVPWVEQNIALVIEEINQASSDQDSQGK